MAAETKFFEADIGKKTFILKQTADDYNRLFESTTASFAKEVENQTALAKQLSAEKLKIEQALKNEVDSIRKEQLKSELDNIVASLKIQKTVVEKAEQELADKEAEIKKKVSKASEIYQINAFKRMNVVQKREYQKTILEELDARKKQRDQENILLEDSIREQEKLMQTKAKRGASDAEKAAAAKIRADAKAKKAELEGQLQKNKDADADDSKKRDIAAKGVKTFSKSELILSKDKREEKRQVVSKLAADKTDAAHVKVAQARAKLEQAEATALSKLNAKDRKAAMDAQKKLQLARQNGDKKSEEAIQAQYNKLLEKSKEYTDAQEELQDALTEEQKAANEEVAQELKNNMGRALEGVGGAALNVVNKVSSGIKGNLEEMYGQQGRMIGRLQGSQVDWEKSIRKISTTVGMSGIVSQKEIVKKMTELVDSGVAYNLELRAFLAETSENIASTFDAANGTLLRLIRIQQADTTAARLGMEASLTKLFNEYFSDSSYLTSNGPADTISDMLLDVSATMDSDSALQFEFAVQKWLGSLYSVGMSSDAVQKIAQGIQYLGTGNVTALAGNESLQTLFAMSASRSGGKSYAELLTDGLNASETNDLLKSMVEYLAEIAASQTNYVTKAAYADLFDMSITDLNTFTSLTTEEIEKLSLQKIDYESSMKETQDQLNSIVSRLSISKLVDTAVDNAEVGAATTIGSTAFSFGMWKATEILKSYVGEIRIPGITGMGTGIASGLDLLNIAQTIMAGFGLIGSLVSGISSLASGGPALLSNWDFDPTTQRGSNLSLIESGSKTDKSFSAKIGVGSTSGEDVESTSMQSGKDSAYDSAETTSEELEQEKEIYNKIYEAISDDNGTSVLTLLQSIYEDGLKVIGLSPEEGQVVTPPKTNDSESGSNGSSSSSTIDNIYSKLQSGISVTVTNLDKQTSSQSDSTVVLNKIHDAISDGENASVLSVLQEIKTTLNDNIAEYAKSVATSVASSSSSVQQITILSSQIESLINQSNNNNESTTSATVNGGSINSNIVGNTQDTQSNNTATSSSKVNGAVAGIETADDLSSVIAAAVEIAIRNIAGYSSGSGLPVTVTNINTFGGM